MKIIQKETIHNTGMDEPPIRFKEWVDVHEPPVETALKNSIEDAFSTFEKKFTVEDDVVTEIMNSVWEAIKDAAEYESSEDEYEPQEFDIMLIRDNHTDQGTTGELIVGELRFYTIEPPWRDNQPNISCIPQGTYTLMPHLSPRFGRCLLVDNVPGRSDILFHAGNVGGDTNKGLHTHTLGCLLPGLSRGSLPFNDISQNAVLSSRQAMQQLLAEIVSPTTITIECTICGSSDA